MGWRPSAGLMCMLVLALCSSLLLAMVFIFPNSQSFEHEMHFRRYGHAHADGHNAHTHDAHSAHVEQARPKRAEMKLEEEPKTFIKWNGYDVPTEGIWNFEGLPVDMGKKAKPYDKQIIADYDINAVNADHPEPEYLKAGPHGRKAFEYPDRLDPLFLTVSTKPRILYFPRIATEAELTSIINTASPRLARSQVALTKGSKGQSATQEVRTSHSTWVNLQDDLAKLEKRMVGLTRVNWHEPMNVLKYQVNQHYDSHHDYFDPSMYGEQASNRMATFFIYLNDTPAGGATTVPRANGGAMPRNYKEASCQQGLQVLPRRGSAILMYDMRPDLSLDQYSLHGGCDVKEGHKWGGVVWYA